MHIMRQRESTIYNGKRLWYVVLLCRIPTIGLIPRLVPKQFYPRQVGQATLGQSAPVVPDGVAPVRSQVVSSSHLFRRVLIIV